MIYALFSLKAIQILYPLIFLTKKMGAFMKFVLIAFLMYSVASLVFSFRLKGVHAALLFLRLFAYTLIILYLLFVVRNSDRKTSFVSILLSLFVVMFYFSFYYRLRLILVLGPLIALSTLIYYSLNKTQSSNRIVIITGALFIDFLRIAINEIWIFAGATPY